MRLRMVVECACLDPQDYEGKDFKEGVVYLTDW